MEKFSKVSAIMDELNVDAILVSDGYNMRYISRFTGATGYLLITKTSKYLFTDFRYTFQAQEQSKDFEVIEVGKEGYYKLILDYLEYNHCKCVAFENLSMLYSDYKKMTETLENISFVEINDKLKNLRIIKTPDELNKLRQAEKIGDIAFANILNVIKPGITELDIAAELEYIMKKNGAEGLSFDTIVASGVNSSMPHAGVSSKKICNGDFITMDFGCKYEGYCSDMTRTVVVGKASDEQKKIYSTVLEAQKAALNFIRSGLTGCEVDKVARDIIDNNGYKGCFGHGLGHSVGLEIHENPRFSPTEKSTIYKGTIETVEPGIYIKDFGGVRIEDMVLVTEDGYQNFTSSDKGLIEL